jgi:hypothetical protein
MSTTGAHTLPHLPYPVALILAAQIDAVTPSADTLCKAGFPYPVATELARQMGVGTATLNDLIACGINPHLAAAIKVAIDAT